ncbi:MAG: hypothetical protein EBZ77_17325, partial [Chitinophagia bacterium]|nr:hypothetical protein [Chitinophagia bacterium]
MKLLFSSALLLAFSPLHGQIKVIAATRQDWSGGVAGHRGTYYNFSLSSPIGNLATAPDSIWIGNEGFLLAPTGNNQQATIKTSKKGKTQVYDISIRRSFTDSPYGPVASEKGTSSLPAPSYKGVALISFYKGSERKYITI